MASKEKYPIDLKDHLSLTPIDWCYRITRKDHITFKKSSNKNGVAHV